MHCHQTIHQKGRIFLNLIGFGRIRPNANKSKFVLLYTKNCRLILFLDYSSTYGADRLKPFRERCNFEQFYPE